MFYDPFALRRVSSTPPFGHNVGHMAIRASTSEHGILKLRRAIRRRAEVFVARTRRRVFPLRVRHVAGPATVASDDGSVVVVCLVRDGAAHLDDFVRHYRGLGASGIVLLDNGSTDGTVDRAAEFDDVTVLHTAAPFRTYKRAAKRYLTDRFGETGWVLCVDIDEFFDYPYRDRVPLADFLGYLRAHRFSAVVSYLLDVFPAGPLLATGSRRAGHCNYDLTEIETEPYVRAHPSAFGPATTSLRAYSGGIRKKAFGVRANLTKQPLLYPPGGPVVVAPHRIRGGVVADVTGVLVHYKYVGPFYEHAHRAVRERSYYRNSEEYQRYLAAFAREPDLALNSPTSRELRHVDQLVDEGFLVVSEAYRRLAGKA